MKKRLIFIAVLILFGISVVVYIIATTPNVKPQIKDVTITVNKQVEVLVNKPSTQAELIEIKKEVQSYYPGKEVVVNIDYSFSEEFNQNLPQRLEAQQEAEKLSEESAKKIYQADPKASD